MKAVIFDIDNTIYSYGVCDRAGVRSACSRLNLIYDVPEQDFLSALKSAKEYTKKNNAGTAASHNRVLYFQNLCEQLGIHDTDMVIELYNAYWEIFLYKMKLFPMVTETFEMLRENNVKIAFCTDLTAHIQLRKLSRLNLQDAADAIVTSEECGAEKPDKRIFEMVLRKLGVAASEAVMVGDDYKRDIEGAANAGITPVWLTEKGEYVRTAEDFRAVYNILKGLL